MQILNTLKQLTDKRGDEVEAWFARERFAGAPYLTTSVDLRHSGLRLVPVDTNLFPAGFHLLSPMAKARASRFFARYFSEQLQPVKRVLIVPENHTRNLAYLENLVALKAILQESHVEARIGSLVAEPGVPLALTSLSGAALVEYPLCREGDRIRLEDGFDPEMILMNNDMTPGAPDLLQNLVQPVVPPLGMGWYRRRKSVHFGCYRLLVQKFCAAFSLDPWLLAAEFYQCGRVDFKERTGLDCLAEGVEYVLARARKKHEEYSIKEPPYVFVKADSGTYGMGIITVRDAQEIFELNKKDRNKMNVIKEGAQVSEVIIQEGIPTVDVVDGKPAEPMVYMVDGVPAGGMYRINSQRDAFGNLNAAGMEFTGMCDEIEDECGEWKMVEGCHFRSFGLVAALAALAAAREDYESYMINL